MSPEASDCRGPEHCIDDLCVSSDQGLCGKWRVLDEFGDDEWEPMYEDEDDWSAL